MKAVDVVWPLNFEPHDSVMAKRRLCRMELLRGLVLWKWLPGEQCASPSRAGSMSRHGEHKLESIHIGDGNSFGFSSMPDDIEGAFQCLFALETGSQG